MSCPSNSNDTYLKKWLTLSTQNTALRQSREAQHHGLRHEEAEGGLRPAQVRSLGATVSLPDNIPLPCEHSSLETSPQPPSTTMAEHELTRS